MPAHPHSVSLIDDDESMCQALTRLLTASGFTVRSFFSAEAFLDDAEAVKVDSLVVDVGLPGMSGIELVQYLRSRRGLVPTIAFISAHDEAEIRQEAEAAGCVVFLRKPFPGISLITALKAAQSNASSLSAPDNLKL